MTPVEPNDKWSGMGQHMSYADPPTRETERSDVQATSSSTPLGFGGAEGPENENELDETKFWIRWLREGNIVESIRGFLKLSAGKATHILKLDASNHPSVNEHIASIKLEESEELDFARIFIQLQAGTFSAGAYLLRFNPVTKKFTSDWVRTQYLPAKGSLISSTGEEEPIAVGVGEDGKVLVADSTKPSGLRWGTMEPKGGLAGGDLTGEYPNPTIAKLVITAEKLAEEAVTGSKIANLAVTAAKIAAEAIETAKIKLEAITTGTIANLAVTAAKIAGEAVETAKIKAEAVTEGKIANLAVTAAKLAGEAVETAKIKAEAVTEGKIANLAITAAKIAKETITGEKLAALAVTGAKIAKETITGEKLVNLTITAAQIAAEAIESAKIKAEAVTEGKIANLAVTAAKIAKETITGEKLAASAKELFVQLLTAGAHKENFGKVEVGKSATVEVEHGLGSTPNLVLLTSNPALAAAVGLTEVTATKLKIKNPTETIVIIYWLART